MQGRTLSHYEVLDPIGSGGMGDVYRARDTKLDRDVALKVLRADLAADPERRTRFLREAKAVAGLVHPNIVTLYSVDQAGENGETLFLTMELIEGPTLDHEIPTGGLRLPRLLDLAIPLADAVSFAHGRGVTHRDLKPSNIMIDGHGRLRVLDFGLVKLLEPPTPGDADATVQMAGDATADGRILGTAAYMSPEQAQGLPVDHRTDIFSLGVLLYEMATGTRPFQGDTSVSTISSVLKDEPRPISELNASLPRHLGRIIHKCLAKDPAQRYQTAQDLKTDLQGLKAETESGITEEHVPATREKPVRKDSVAAGLRGWLPYLIVLIVLTGLVYVWRTYVQGPPSAERMLQAMGGADDPAGRAAADLGDRTLIAVLPFDNLGAPEDDYFAEGVTEELISRLATVEGLGVIAKQTASRYADSDKSIAAIGGELGVDYVIEGSIRWDRSGDGPGRVRVTPHLTRVSDETQLWSDRYDESVEAIFAVQDRLAENIVAALGEALGGTRLVADGADTGTDDFEAHRLYLQAIALDAGPTDLAIDSETIPRLLQEALELDPEFVDAWAALSRFHAKMVHYSVDPTEERLALCRRAADRVTELAPESVLAHLTLGYYYYHGRKQYQRALEEFEATGQLDSNPDVMQAVAFVNRRMGNFDRAVELQERASVLDPGNPEVWSELYGTYENMKRYEDAVRTIEKVRRLEPDDPFTAIMLGFTRANMTGTTAPLREALESFEDSSFPFIPLAWAFVHTIEEDYEAAYASLERFPFPVLESPGDYLQVSSFQFRLLQYMGDPRAEEKGQEALAEVEAAVAERPGDWRRRQARAEVLALLGRKDEALRDAQLGVDMMPVSQDAMFGFEALENQAGILLAAGEIEKAVALYRQLMTTPNTGVTRTTLRLNADLHHLRDHPAVRELLDPAS